MTTAPATPETIEKKPRDPVAQGVHILKSYLSSCSIPFKEGTQPNRVFVQSKDGDWVDVIVGPDNHIQAGIQVSVDAITSYDLERAVFAFWGVTGPTGYGTPLPVDRGQKAERVSYLDDGGFELAYLRHTIFRRSPNKTEAELAPYMQTVKSASRRAHFRWNSIFTAMGFDVDDLVNVGRVYTTSFLHNYAYETDLTKQIRLLTAYLNQRFGEFAKICYKKALNVTCLPTQVKSGPIATGDDGEEINYIDTYAEADTTPADEEYEAGEYRAIIKTDKGAMEAKLEIRPGRMLGVDLYLNGSLLPRSQAESFREGINAGRVKLMPMVEPEPEQPVEVPESELDRRLRARAELQAKLNAMTPEQREHALGYAAFSRDFDPDARREARRLSEELACPKCLRKVPSGAVCLTCGVEARPRYGVDYVAYKEKLKSENHSLAEAMTAPIPDSEVRSRQKRAKVSNSAPLVDAQPDEKAPEAPASAVVMSKEEIKALSKKMSEEFMASLPDILVCPKCNAKKSKHEFGIRVPRDKTTGVPVRPVRQSYCKPCRKTQ